MHNGWEVVTCQGTDICWSWVTRGQGSRNMGVESRRWNGVTSQLVGNRRSDEVTSQESKMNDGEKSGEVICVEFEVHSGIGVVVGAWCADNQPTPTLRVQYGAPRATMSSRRLNTSPITSPDRMEPRRRERDADSTVSAGGCRAG